MRTGAVGRSPSALADVGCPHSISNLVDMTPLDWLLDSDPSIRWQVMRDLTHEPVDLVRAERSLVATEGWGARLLSLQGIDGQWGRDVLPEQIGGPEEDLPDVATRKLLRDLHRVSLDELAGYGLTRVLCEGGPSLLGDVAAAGRLDELCLTISPQLVGGDGPRVVRGPGLDLGLSPASLLEQDGVLLARYVVAGRSGPAGRG